MTRLSVLLAIVLSAAFPAAAETSVIPDGRKLVVLTGAYPSRNAIPWVETNAVPAQGAVYRVQGAIRQYTANGWRPVIEERSLFIIRRMAGPGSAIVSDGRGELIVLDDDLPAVSFWGDRIQQSPVWVAATNGAVTVFASQR
jgi:hypothetical protein